MPAEFLSDLDDLQTGGKHPRQLGTPRLRRKSLGRA